MKEFVLPNNIVNLLTGVIFLNIVKNFINIAATGDEIICCFALFYTISDVHSLTSIPKETKLIFASIFYLYMYTFSSDFCHGIFLKLAVYMILYSLLLLRNHFIKDIYSHLKRLLNTDFTLTSFTLLKVAEFKSLHLICALLTLDVGIKVSMDHFYYLKYFFILFFFLLIYKYGFTHKEAEPSLKIPSIRKKTNQLCDENFSYEEDESDYDVIRKLKKGDLKTRNLEYIFKSNLTKAVHIRRKDLQSRISNPIIFERIPFKDYDYKLIFGQCCEEVIGYMPIPLGKAGPIKIDGREHYVPMATTEGCLVASVNRGSRVISMCGGTKTAVYRDGMTRAPVVSFESIQEVVECIAWLHSTDGFHEMKVAFDSASGHADLRSIYTSPIGRYLHIRFSSRTGDAMGMNIVSKSTEMALTILRKKFPLMKVISLSGNMCTDKKPASINHILGRGKSVLVEARIPSDVLKTNLRTTPEKIAKLSMIKNYLGTSFAGGLGMAGFNAHAANIVAAIFAATGQDLAQVVNSSACAVVYEAEPSLDASTTEPDLVITITMPCLEVGTIGGGTRLAAQRSCIELMDLDVEQPTEHLARVIASTVMAGELSLLSSLENNDLVSAHMKLNRSKLNTFKNPDTHRNKAVSYSNVNANHPVM